MKNLSYQTDQIARYFSGHRIAWEQFYDSERKIIGEAGIGPATDILDIGCGCGGLGVALRERFGAGSYTGVEINQLAAEAGRRLNPQARLLVGDILDLSGTMLRGRRFDVVFSLSCVDWNVCFAEMLAAAWEHVRPGGYLIATFRLTAEAGCDDFARSFQYINFDGARSGERAAYVVLNAGDLGRHLAALDPAAIRAYGYWGPPSATAVTPYARLCFAAFAIRRRRPDEAGTLDWQLDLPPEITAEMAPRQP